MDKSQLAELKDRLPKKPGINGMEEFFNSAVLVLLTYRENEFHLVFEKRASGIKQGDEICFPGGGFDPEKDLDYRETVLRETFEELGLTKEKIEIIGRLDTVIAPMGATVDVFVGLVDFEAIKDLNVNHQEVAEIFTIPVAFFAEHEPEIFAVELKVFPYSHNKAGEEVLLLPARELGLPERYTKPWGNVRRKIYLYRRPEGVIWGITARIIVDLINKVKIIKQYY